MVTGSLSRPGGTTQPTTTTSTTATTTTSPATTTSSSTAPNNPEPIPDVPLVPAIADSNNSSSPTHPSDNNQPAPPNNTTRTILAPPRSTSLSSATRFRMGQALSKSHVPAILAPSFSSPTPRSASPLSPSSGPSPGKLGAGSKLKRVLASAGRRKKSEDVSRLVLESRDDLSEHDSLSSSSSSAIAAAYTERLHGYTHLQQGRASQLTHHDRSQIEVTSSSPSPSPSPSPSNIHAGHSSPARNISQLATQIFTSTGSRKTSKSPLRNPPPLPPKGSTPPLPSAPSELAPELQARGGSPLALHANDNRSSIIPMSSEVTSAVNYLRMTEDEGEAKQEQVDTPAEGDEASTTLKPRERRSQGEKDVENVDAWRKSDSTIGQHTLSTPAVTRPSRPVSMAESLQSTHTIVPVGRRTSVLIDDPDFGMPEEDDSYKSAQEELPPCAPEKDVRLDGVPPTKYKDDSSPSSSLKSRNRRSMSLSVTTQNMFSKPKLLRAPSTSPPTQTAYRGTGSPLPPRDVDLTPSLSRNIIAPPTGASSNLRTPRATTTPRAPTHHPSQSSSVAYTAFPPPSSARMDRALPPPPVASRAPHLGGQLRQTAVSITGGLAPAAGLAKRAVEKMGRAWGINTGSSPPHVTVPPNSSSITPSSSYSASTSGHLRKGHKQKDADQREESGGRRAASSYVVDDFAAVPPVTPAKPKRGVRLRRTPNAPSISSTHSSATTGSVSDSEAFGIPSGPNLGNRVRGPLRTKPGGGLGTGMVFGRDLGSVVRDTAVGVGRWEGDGQDEVGGWAKRLSAVREEMEKLESRMLPALAVRCAQHLLIWGIQEEGLFRVNGRPAHVSRLRAEFDSGADWDMTECDVADLDPHAVSSLFKAFLRELPEPVLTYSLTPYFDALMTEENARNDGEGYSSQGLRIRGLPNNPRDATSLPAVRKAPSLSTFATPSLNGIRPPSKFLLRGLQSLLSQLPEENRDLILTVTELIRATARESKHTKMPLSNLLLVFCPSLNMSPPLLKVLCEGEGIWDDVALEVRSSSPEQEDIFEDAKDGISEAEEESSGRRSEDKPESNAYYGSVEDSEEHSLYDSSSMSQPAGQDSPVDDGSSYASVSEDQNVSCGHQRSNSLPLLTSSVESLDTPDSDGHLSPPAPIMQQESIEPIIADPTAEHSPDAARRPYISYPIPITVDAPVQFPSVNDPPSPDSDKRRSVPVLALPSFSGSPILYQGMPPSQRSASPPPVRTRRKPSLQLLFSKKSSSSSLASRPVISGPYPQDEPGSSDSSVSTPISAVTAFQSSTSVLPPQLEMALKNSPLNLGLGIDLPPTDMVESSKEPEPTRHALAITTAVLPKGTPSLASITTNYTPIADQYQQRSPAPSTALSTDSKWTFVAPPSPETQLALPVSRRKSSAPRDNHLGLLEDRDFSDDWTRTVLLAAEVNGGWTIANHPS